MLKYRLKKLGRPKVIFWSTFILLFFVSMVSIVRFYAAPVDSSDYQNGIIGDTVYVNDTDADWNYYDSLNYTEITSKTVLPSGNSNKYNKNTMVWVQINYDGKDINRSWTGYISPASGEKQSKLVYYKYVPIKNDEVTIELIDNPYSWRPKSGSTRKGFNGWVCDDEKTTGVACTDMEFSYDYDYYLRYVTIPKSAVQKDSNGNLVMTINLRATWIDATVITSYNSFSSLKQIGMVALPKEELNNVKREYTGEYDFIDGEKYYEKKYADLDQSFNGYWINESGVVEDYLTNANTCVTGLYGNEVVEEVEKCVYYTLTTDTAADKTKEYWLESIDDSGVVSLNKVDFTTGDGLYAIFNLVTEGSGQYKLKGYNNGDSLAGLYYATTLGTDKSLYYNADGQRCDMSGVTCSGTVYKLIQTGDSLANGGESISTMNIHTTNYTQEENWDYATKYTVKNGMSSSTNKYYYLVTRDTNIIYISSGTINSDTISTTNKSYGKNGNNAFWTYTNKRPYTLTGSPTGETISASLTVNWMGLVAFSDMVIENIKANTNLSDTTDRRSSESSSSNTIFNVKNLRNYQIVSLYNNVKIGRNIVKQTSKFFAGGVVGTVDTHSNNFSPSDKKSKTIVESGSYSYTRTLGEATLSTSDNANIIMVYGSDYDRVKNDNSKFTVYRTISASVYGGTHNSDSYVPVSDVIVKSGTIGVAGLSSTTTYAGSDHYATGIYAGSYMGSTGSSTRRLKIEGGRIACVNGGPGVSGSVNNIVNVIYMTGGLVTNIAGGAGTDGSTGSRLVSVSGGTVRNAVSGSSNSNVGGGTGTLDGSTVVYVGGNAIIGDSTLTTSNLFGVTEKGSVFGGGLGRSGSTTAGTVVNSRVIINGGTINGSVYGGGNYGAVGTNKDAIVSTKMELYDGIVQKSVYGGSNQNSFGKSGYKASSTINITVDGVDVKGSIYGGSNLKGVIYGKVNINMLSGTVGSLYGGANNITATANATEGNTTIKVSGGTIKNTLYGGSNTDGDVNGIIDIDLTGGSIGVNCSLSDKNLCGVFGGGYGSATNVKNNVTIDTSVTNDANLKVYNIYGGSALGKTNNSASSTYTTTININGGTVTNAIYGGGMGSSSVKPYTYGNITVNVKKGVINEVYGGSNINGNLPDSGNTMKVNVSGGTINKVYGGSKGASATVTTSNVSITGGTIKEKVYGGGNAANTTTSNVSITGGQFYNLSDDIFKADVFGGGAKAKVTTANVTVSGTPNLYNVYGGSETSGLVTTTNVTMSAGNVYCNVYGGGYEAPTTTSNVNLVGTEFTYSLSDSENANNTECGNAFGGGASADVTTANITLNGSKLIALYGGSNEAGNVTNSKITTTSGAVSSVFGGNNKNGATRYVTMNLNSDAVIIENVYGGSNGKDAIIGYEPSGTVIGLGSVTINFNAGVINNDLFGGGNEAPVYGNVIVNMKNGTVNRLYGGGNKAFVGDTTTTENKYSDSDTTSAIVGSITTKVNVAGGTVVDNLYGSGNASFVDGSTYINIANASEVTSTNKVVKIGGSIFGGSETNAEEDKTFQYKSIGVGGDANIKIDGTNYFNNNGISTVSVSGSIYGGGNNSATRGVSSLQMNKIGSKSKPMAMASIQRLTTVFIKDSYLMLDGARDRASDKRYMYSFVRIDDLYLLGTRTTSSTLNGSELYLRRGTTFLKKYSSGTYSNDLDNFIVDDFDEQTVTEKNGVLTNGYSNNKIYMYENIVFAVSDSQEIKYDDSAGSVVGMTFLGMYNNNNNTINRGVYRGDFEEGDYVGRTDLNAITSSAYTYVYGQNDYAENIQKKNHGFYTNKVLYDDEGNPYVDVDYVGVTPIGADYYKWVIGIEPEQIIVDLEATKYSIYGAKNVTITLDALKEQINGQSFEWRDAIMKIRGVDTSGFIASKDDVIGGKQFDTYLVDKTDIKAVNVDDDNNDGVVDANNYFALSMGTTTSGWLDNYKTNFYEKDRYTDVGEFCQMGNGDCSGDDTYVYDSTTLQRGLTFWLHHSKNLDFSVSSAEDRENAIISLGSVVIRAEFTNPHTEHDDASQQVDVEIIVNITMSDSTKDAYGKAISPGTKFSVFDTASTSIPTNGVFSIYHSLALDLTRPKIDDDSDWKVEELYGTEEIVGADSYSESYRYLASNYLLPKGTKITMLDLVMGEQYYYEVTKEKMDAVKAAAGNSSEYKYKLEEFIRMGSTDDNNKYDDDMNGPNSSKYYTHNGEIEVAVEEFIFTVDFSNVASADMIKEIKRFYLFMQLSRDKNGAEQIILTSTGVPTEEMVYTLNPDVTSELQSSGGFVDKETQNIVPSTKIYVGEDTDLELRTSFINKRADGTTAVGVTNTTYENYKLGAKLTIHRPSKDDSGNVLVDSNGNTIYEQITNDLFGTVVTINGVNYYPQTDGTIRIQLAGRVSEVLSDINIDFSNSDLVFGDYKLVVETFVSYDGLYYGDADVVKTEFAFTLLNNQYGIKVTVPPVQITHDVNTGLDKNGSAVVNYVVETINGVSDPYLRVSLQRRNYSSYFDTTYTNIDLKNIADIISVNNGNGNILASCYSYNANGACDVYTIADMNESKDLQTFKVDMTMKTGPFEAVADLSSALWKSGTYRVVFTIYDGKTPVGSVYEYLIIRSLDVDEIIERSAN